MIVNFTKPKGESFWRFPKRIFPVFFILLLFTGNVIAQGISVTGTVKDANGEALIGASVSVVGMKRASTTNHLGQYIITAPKSSSLEITYMGFLKQVVKVDGQTEIHVVLKEDSRKLDEVVVVGYGTIAKSDFTGSSSAVKLDRTEEGRVVNIAEALQGKVAGVEIMNNTGQPGSGITFNIRGMTSITGSSQPLIVIDGQPIESSFGATSAGTGLDGGAEIPPADPLASLNPADIESVEILKDASSIAIYGSRGANGVVLITTKSGKTGNDKVTYTNRFDLNMLPKQLAVLNTRDYLHYRNEASLNDGNDSVYTQTQIDDMVANGPNVNWQDEIYKDALSQDHQIAFSGKDEKSNFFITGNYADQNSILLNAYYKRYGLRANYTRNISKKLTISLRSYFSLADRNYGQESNWTGILGSSAVMGALSFNPLRTAYNEEDGTIDEEYANNPLLVATIVKDKTQIRTLTSNLNLDYKITKNLTYTARGGVNDLYSLRQLYYPRGTFIGNTAPNGSATRADNANSNFLMEHLLSYRKVFSRKHSVNAVGGYSFQKWHSKSSSNTTMNFSSDNLEYFNMESGASPGRMYTGVGDRSLQSVLGRANYSYDKKYLLTLTGRYDGATRLAEGHKWQFFPSVGLGWNVSNEDFFKDNIKFISNLKLRGSYGISGNENIAIGATKERYGVNYVVVGSDIVPSTVTSDFANPNLKWETTSQINVGAEFGFAENRATLSIDFFKKNTKDLLINLALPASSGYSDYFTNVGEVVNKGMEMESSYRILSGKVNWTAGANLTVLRNKVLDMGAAGILYGRTYFAGGAVLLSQPAHVAKVGFPISSFWGYKTEGVYQNAAEVAAGPEATTAKPGDVKWSDTNKDGQITDDDKTVLGDPSPDFTYGFNTSLSYKRFTLGIVFFGSQGNELINLTRWIVGINNTNGGYNLLQSAYDGRWRGEGTSNVLPKVTSNSVRINQRLPDWLVEDASFFRLQTLNLGYTFYIPQLKSTSIRAYVSGTNLFTITKYSGYDPNVNAFGHLAINKGVDLGTMPQPRTFSAGVSVTF